MDPNTDNERRNAFQSMNRRRLNVEKHMRLARALPYGHEQSVHVKRATKLIDRYGMRFEKVV